MIITILILNIVCCILVHKLLASGNTKNRVFIICLIGCFIINILISIKDIQQFSFDGTAYFVGYVTGITLFSFAIGYYLANYIFKSKFIEDEN